MPRQDVSAKTYYQLKRTNLHVINITHGKRLHCDSVKPYASDCYSDACDNDAQHLEKFITLTKHLQNIQLG